MTKVLIRFRGLCVFVADNPDLPSATEVTVLFVDAESALPGVEPHLTALTFSSKNYSSGAQSGQAIQGPDDLQIGILPLKGMELKLQTESTTPLQAAELAKLALLKDLVQNITDDTIDPPCFDSDPDSEPVDSRFILNNGEFVATGLAKDVFRETQVSFEVAGNQVVFGIRPFDDNRLDSDTLTLHSDGGTIEVGIATLSVRSLDPSAKPDHDIAYVALLKNPPDPPFKPNKGGGGGCVPIHGTHP